MSTNYSMRPYCPDCMAVTEMVVYPADYKEGIVINTNGSSAGRWEDGTRGTTPEQDEDANGEEDIYCLHHLSQGDRVEGYWIAVPN